MRSSIQKNGRPALVVLTILILAGCGLPLRGQEGCRAPLPKALGRKRNIFSEQQEMDLGDAMAEKMARTYRISTDARFTSYLDQIADRLLKFMPATNLHVKISLVDLPNANAFDVAGGRVYIGLKVVAMARNEDELAGVLAHEFGHMVVHQGAIDMSWNFRHWLKVTELSDRRDVYDRFNQLIDTAWHKPVVLTPLEQAERERVEQEKQIVADRLAVYALAGAGYSSEAGSEIFDRMAETRGKKGNWFTDFLGGENPDSKRLREMVNTAAKIPEACIGSSRGLDPSAFKAWQSDVIENIKWGSQELLHSVLKKIPLDPPLRGEITNLKFSPDGKHILAQDAGNIYVLSREPFKAQLQIPAYDAAEAQFSADSQSVVFNTRRQRVETWNIAAQKRTSVREIVVQGGCTAQDLSPDGRVLVCLERNSDLILFNVATGQEVLHQDLFLHQSLELLAGPYGFTPGYSLRFFMAEGFSPDGRYFLASNNVHILLVDLRDFRIIPLPETLKRHLTGNFAFLGSDRLIAVNVDDPAHSHVLEFPSGKILEELAVGQLPPATAGRGGNAFGSTRHIVPLLPALFLTADVAAATRGDYVLVRPVKDYDVGVIDLKSGKHLFASKKAALDIFDEVGVGEANDGELALFDIRSLRRLALAQLPHGQLGALKADALSSDWKWLAASEEARGAVWNLESGKAFYNTRGFRGAYFSHDGFLYADFPKYQEKEREIARLSLAAPQITDGIRITEEHAQQFGQYLLLVKPEEKSAVKGLWVDAISPLGWNPLFERVTWEVDDVGTGAKLWSQHFPKEAPTMAVDYREQLMVYSMDASSHAAQVEMRAFPPPGGRLPSRKEKEISYLVGVLDPRTGRPIGSIIVNAGGLYFSLQGAGASHHWIALADRNNRMLVYSMSSGEEIGRFFGAHPAFSSTTDLISIENEDGHVTLYDINTGQDLDRWVFSSPVVMLEFSADGKRLFVLTADQTAYVLDVSSFAGRNVANTSTSGQAKDGPENTKD